MRVITISEDNHGLIGIAKTYADAVCFLVEEHWLSELTEVIKSDETETTVIQDLGEEWFAKMLEWSMEQFCDYFEGCFYLNSKSVYEAV